MPLPSVPAGSVHSPTHSAPGHTAVARGCLGLVGQTEKQRRLAAAGSELWDAAMSVRSAFVTSIPKSQ